MDPGAHRPWGLLRSSGARFPSCQSGPGPFPPDGSGRSPCAVPPPFKADPEHGAAEAFGELPDDPGAQAQLGMIALNRGQTDQAIAHLERVLELEPEGPNAELARSVLAALRPSGSRQE